MKCNRCFIENSAALIDGLCMACWNKEYSKPSIGWICPICGFGVSPLKDKCDCKETFKTN